MGPETVNKLKDNEIYGDFVGHDKITNIILFQDSEREFVVTHNANIKPVSYFTGRETELQDLRQRVEEGRKSVLVSGMGGIGKTHICRKLFEEYLTKHTDGAGGPFQHIGYVEYSGDMSSSIQNCLKYKQQDQPETNQEAAWKELEYLASDGKLLLFVDNVDKPMKEDPDLQRLNSIPGAVVLTSRQVSFSDEFEPYQIGFLSAEQCKDIFEKIRFEDSGGKVKTEEVPDLMYIIETLVGRHTITVEFLAHLARTKLWTVKRLRDELEKKGFGLQFRKNGELINIQEEYEKLYDLSKLTEAEQNILEAFSVFPYIPLSAETCNEWLLPDARVNEDDDILTELYQKGWLQFNLEQESYVMHPVFAQFIYDKYKPNAKNHLGLINACKYCLEISHNSSVLECQKIIAFAENIVEKLNVVKVGFIYALAKLLMYVGEYKKAEGLYEAILETYKNALGENHSNTAASYNNLASLYEIQGEYGKAEELYEKCMRISESVLGENHPDTAICYNNLARLYWHQGKYEKAEKLYESSIRINESVLGENHPDTATCYNNLAVVYMQQGAYAKAEKLYEKSLCIFVNVLGKNHPDTVNIYSNLAIVYMEQGKYTKAEELHEKSLHFCENVLGKNHPVTATQYTNLAVVYEYKGEHEKAKEFLEKGLKIRLCFLGENHPATANSYSNLAKVYVNQREYKKAIAYFLKAYKIFALKLGLNHQNTQNVYNNMEIAYSECNPDGDFEQWLNEKMKEEE